MSELCPHCGGTGRAPARPGVVEQLRQWCAQNGHHLSPDGSVFEHVAAEILGRSPGTLRNWRSAGSSLPYQRHGRTGRVRYRITDLAAMLEATVRDE